MHTQKPTLVTAIAVQVLFVAAFGIAYARLTPEIKVDVTEAVTGTTVTRDVPLHRIEPLRIDPLYDDESVVTFDELAAVLQQIRPRFDGHHMKPNFIEHALRAWGVDAEFQEPGILSGVEMRDFLTDHGRFIASWGDSADPLLMERPGDGVSVRWGRQPGASVHHDHWLACLTEAGVRLDQPVFTPARRDMTLRQVLLQSLRDFRVDERETEWSAMAFGLWLTPDVNTWINNEGRQVSFDLLARRLIRGHKRLGVCSGTHRVYSLTVLYRLNRQFDGKVLSPVVSDEVYAHLETIRDLITVAQFPDGRWPSNWSDGRDAVDQPIDDEEYRQVIATGHHLEWLAIAPQDLHPPHDQIERAADWIVQNVTSATPEQIQDRYTFYSHVGNALALWRNTRPAVFWKQWRADHPWTPESASESAAESVTE